MVGIGNLHTMTEGHSSKARCNVKEVRNMFFFCIKQEDTSEQAQGSVQAIFLSPHVCSLMVGWWFIIFYCVLLPLEQTVLDSIYECQLHLEWSANDPLMQTPSGNLLLTTQILSTCSCHAKPVRQHTKVINTGAKVACNMSKFGWCGCNRTLSCEVMARNFHQTNLRSRIQSPVSPSPPCPQYGPAKSTVPAPNRTNSH